MRSLSAVELLLGKGGSRESTIDPEEIEASVNAQQLVQAVILFSLAKSYNFRTHPFLDESQNSRIVTQAIVRASEYDRKYRIR